MTFLFTQTDLLPRLKSFPIESCAYALSPFSTTYHLSNCRYFQMRVTLTRSTFLAYMPWPILKRRFASRYTIFWNSACSPVFLGQQSNPQSRYVLRIRTIYAYVKYHHATRKRWDRYLGSDPAHCSKERSLTCYTSWLTWQRFGLCHASVHSWLASEVRRRLYR